MGTGRIEETIRPAGGQYGGSWAGTESLSSGNGALRQRIFEVADEEQLARGLGWFSIGLGLTEVLVPRLVARVIGVQPHPALFCFLGVREIASGVGILTRRKPAEWLWSRVAGDIVDLALLGAAMTGARNGHGRLLLATAAVAGVTTLDLACSQQISRSKGLISEDGSIRVAKSLMINRSPEQLYRFWRDFQNLPRFMFHLESAHLIDDKRSHWVAKGPGGRRVEWDAEIVEERPNEMIAWRSLEGSDVDHSGAVRFERGPAGRGTIVRVEMRYSPPAGVMGAAAARLFGREPAQQVQEDLRRFKQLMESGDIITTEGQPAGRPQSTSWKYDVTSRHDAAVHSLQQNPNGGAS
jgi:uncharacterized membrane protein